MKMYALEKLNSKIKQYEDNSCDKSPDEKKQYESDRIDHTILEFIKKPVLEMIKDSKDTFKPYKDRHQIWRELYQPLLGVGNLILGFSLIIFYPALVFISLPENKDLSFKGNLKLYALDFPAIALMLFRGATQIVAWPLTLLRMPLRAFLTWKQPAIRIEESKGLQELVNLYQEEEQKKPQEQKQGATDTQQYIAKILKQKFDKAVARNQDTKIQPDTGFASYDVEFTYNTAKSTNDYTNFIGLFTMAIKRVNDEIPERAQVKSTVTTTATV